MNELVKIKEKDELQTAVASLLNVADMAINRTYLAECTKYDVIDLRKDDSGRLMRSFTSCTKLFRLMRFVYNPEENITERLQTFYLSLSHLPLNPSVFMVIRNELKTRKNPKGAFGIYLGIRTTEADSSYEIEEMLRESFLGTFLGSELESVPMESVFPQTNVTNLSCVSAMPSVKKDADDKMAKIGMEQFINVMRNKSYTAVFVASPIETSVVQDRKRELENLYTKLSFGRKVTYSFGENESESVSKGISKSIGTSTTTGRSFTETHSDSTTDTYGSGESSSYSSTSTMGWGDGDSTSRTNSSSTSSNWSNSKTVGFSSSAGTSTSQGRSETDGTSENLGQTRGTSRQKTYEMENKNIVNMLEKIDEALKRITDSEAYGLWECAAYFTADTSKNAIFAANTYKALVLGESSSTSTSYLTTWSVPELPHKMQTQSQSDFELELRRKQSYLDELFAYVRHGLHPMLARKKGFYGNDTLFRHVLPTHTVNGKDLPYFLSLPLQSVPGVVVDSIAPFERSVHTKSLSEKTEENGKRLVPLGCVFHMGLEEPTSKVALELDRFTGHCFIAGSTGSGKSNTMARLLEEIVSQDEQPVNFLVIEPAKGEYKKDFHAVPGINIYSTNPFCEQLLHLNPFRFHHGIHVLEHLDRLLNIFGSCWELTAAMPAILKRAVEQAYEKAGWDLCNSYYLGGGEPTYPTFATVVGELRRVIDESDYSAEAKGNYTGALVTRVESLASGILRRIFCSEVDIPYEKLFDGRTIVDLSRLGSQETKTLIMGVLVMLLSEYRMAVAQETNETNKRLQHITVIEEAHNLLKNADASSGGSEVIAKSIEMISNAIAEMRTYGEGFIIVDQSPTAVDISAIKNTNTKIIMRLPEQHDCETVASAMGLNEHQQKEIAKLLQGKAVVMQNDWTAAVMVAIDKARNDFGGQPEIITPQANRFARSELAYAFAGIARKCLEVLAGTQAPLTPETLIDGKTVGQMWAETLRWWAGKRQSLFDSGKKDQGIGKAKIRELQGLCAHFFATNRISRLHREEILPAYGRLIVSLLECEGCWKTYLAANPGRVSALRLDRRSPKEAVKRASLIKRQVSFEEVIRRYAATHPNDDCATLCACIKSLFHTEDGMSILGGTSEDGDTVMMLIGLEKNAVK